jgi:hypothetical protein
LSLGVEFKIQIIFSPIQQNPKENTIQDAKLNTLESDPEFIKFCSKLNSDEEKDKGNNSNEIQLGAQQQSTNEVKKSTPLLEYLKAKKMEKASRNKFKSSSISKGEDGQKSKSGKKSKKEKAAKQAQTTDEASSATKLSKAAKLKKKKAKASEEKGGDGKAPREFTIAKKPSDSTGSPQVEKVVLAKRQDSAQKDNSTNSPTSSLGGAKLAQRSDKSSYKGSTGELKSALQTGEGSGTSTGSPIEKPSSRRARKGKTFPTDQAAGIKQGDKPAGETAAFPKKGKKSINSTTSVKPLFVKSGTSSETQQINETNIAISPRQINYSQDSLKKSDLGITGLANNSGSEANSDKQGAETKFKSKAKPRTSKPKSSPFGNKFNDTEGSTGFKSPTESIESGGANTKPVFKKSSHKPTDEMSGEPRAPKPPRSREANPKFGGKPGQSEEGGDSKLKPKKYRPKLNKPATGTGTAGGTQPNA